MKTEPLNDQQIIRLYKKATGIDAKINELCIKKTKHLQSIVSVGSFAHDLGCLDGRVITVEEMTEKGLQLNGWNADANQQALLLLWTRYVVLAWEHPILSSNDYFYFEQEDTPAFTEPFAKFDTDKWAVHIWVQEPVGVFPTKKFYKAIATYEKSGQLIKIAKVNHFSNHKIN